MYEYIKSRVERAISAFKKGRFAIILDDDIRENEGDLVLSGNLVNTDSINFMLKSTTGIICLAVSRDQADNLGLDLMVQHKDNTSHFKTPFTTTIEASKGITTGVSSKDRARTIFVASNSNSGPKDICKPGHVFPLIAQNHGVFSRQGHTEASVDLSKIAGFNGSTVLCELMNDSGEIMNRKEIKNFSKRFDIPIVNISDIYHYRLANEIFIKELVSTTIPLKYGTFQMSTFLNMVDKTETVVLMKKFSDDPIVRVHSSCITGDLFGSLKCDCQSQLFEALSLISKKGGILIYLNQEGRNIGLTNKLKAYNLQDSQNLDTVEANLSLGFPIDSRRYDVAVQILKNLKIGKFFLLSNNPEKVKAFQNVGLIVKQLNTKIKVTVFNKEYLKSKKEKLGHLIDGVE